MGQWRLAEIIPRTGDGAEPMPDRVNVYSHVAIIENSPDQVIVNWRYLASFTAGNPHGDVSPNNFVDETFTITPDGQVRRIVKMGTARAADWNDPLNQTTQVLRLGTDGVEEISRINPSHSPALAPLAGNPKKGPPVVNPVLCFKFDEGAGDRTTESVAGTSLMVAGPKTYWKNGVSGTALEFDGYNTVVSLPGSKAPPMAGGSLTLEAWFALGAYPWNWAPLVQQGDNDGYFLGVDSHGYPGFMVQVDGVWQQLTISNQPPYTDPNHLATFRWYHLAGTYSKDDGLMRLYLNGKEVASKTVGRGGIQTTNVDVRIGKSGVLRVPTDGTHDTLPSDFGLDGLIDEARAYDVALNQSQVAEAYDRFKPSQAIVHEPDMQPRHFPVPSTRGKFGAQCTKLPYYETWDNLFRFGAYPDVVVGFDKLPTKFVFWRGVSYVAMMVNGDNQWFTEEFAETGYTKDAPGDNEPMSDKGSFDSHVRVIENNGARVVVEWRYRIANPSHHWANYDPDTGWGDIADWYYYIYPDGVASVDEILYTSKPKTWYEWNEQIAVLSPGQRPDGVIRKAPVMTLVSTNGCPTDYDWNPDPPKPTYPGQMIQMIHFTGRQSPFAIQNFTGGDAYKGERTWYAVFPSWNHWPIAQINSSGRNVSFPDRASHSSVSHLIWPAYATQPGKVTSIEKTLLQGMTDQSAASLTNLARSWLVAPAVTNVSGGNYTGYEQPQRAYVFSHGNGTLSFAIAAASHQPIHNLCFEIKHWPSRTAQASLKLNGVSQSAGPDFRQGVNLDNDGTYTLVIWVGLTATTRQRFEVSTP
jgi:hypothetical protein